MLRGELLIDERDQQVDLRSYRLPLLLVSGRYVLIRGLWREAVGEAVGGKGVDEGRAWARWRALHESFYFKECIRETI